LKASLKALDFNLKSILTDYQDKGKLAAKISIMTLDSKNFDLPL
jgi:hypothetical protein